MRTDHPLKSWREAQGISQAELGGSVGVSRWTINSIETGRRKPSRDLIAKLVEKTEHAVSFADFLGQAA